MIIVDERDGSNELIPLIPDCVPCHGLSTDICITGNGPAGDILVGVEVKKLDDLLKSISTGRLAATQLRPLMDDYYTYWLLTIGQYRAGTGDVLQLRGRKGGWYPYRIGNRPVPVGYLESSIIELQEIGLKHHHVETNEGASEWLMRLARWWGKPWDKHKGLQKFDRSASIRVALMPDVDPVTQQIAEVVSKLPGLGYDRAMAAANYFESIDEAMNANIHRWSEIRGIGKVLAKTTVETIKRRRNDK